MSSPSPPPPLLSSSNQRGQPQQQQQQQPVIQTILESFTRCFNPLQHSGCTKIIDGGCGSDDEVDNNNNIVHRTSSLSRDGKNLQNDNSILDHHRQRPELSSRSTSSSELRRKKQQRHDGINNNNNLIVTPDDRRRSRHHRKQLSGEDIEERSIRRKLEIFRCDGASAPRPPVKLLPRQSNSHHHHAPSSSSPAVGGRSSPQSSTSSDDDDLIRLTNSSRKRFSCGGIMNHDSPISNVARLLNLGFTEAQKPFGLCFATPVRASSHEDVSKLPDDRLTADEFLERHAGRKNTTTSNFLTANEITPDHHGSSSNNNTTDSSYNEDETITSTLYFDHKYSHVVQTRPPMPLFREDMLRSGQDEEGNWCGDELSEIIKKRSSSVERPAVEPDVVVDQQQQLPPPPFPTVETVTNWRYRNPAPRNRMLFSEEIAGGGVVWKEQECPSPVKKTTYAYDTKDDGPASPMRIRDESMSTSTADSAEESYHV